MRTLLVPALSLTLLVPPPQAVANERSVTQTPPKGRCRSTLKGHSLMDFGKTVTTILVVIITVLVNPASSEAQDTEVAGSLSWLWLQGDYARWLTYPGWSVDFARGLAPHVSVAVEV